jgi:putative ABC transport system ATP-binding protein
MSAIIQFDQATIIVNDKIILSDISFTLGTGEKAVLCGKSGSGKSTVLKTVLGLLSLTRGAVYFEGKPLNPITITAIRSQTAYIGQDPIMGADTVHDALLLPFQFKAHRDHKPTDTQIIAVLEQLHLPTDILKQDSNRISGGEKQRIALARGLLLGKSLYLLDEVTSALDVESKQAVFDVFTNPNLTVLSVAHDPDWIARCNTILELEDGRLTQVSRHAST